MNQILVTGPSNFLGYQVIKRLNARGITPRALFRSGGADAPMAVKALEQLAIERAEGETSDVASLLSACQGIDTILHLDFVIKLGGGAEVEKQLWEGNVAAATNVLDAARQTGVARVVVSSSVLAVGLGHTPQPIDETADWGSVGFDLAYGLSRRQEEQEALARARAALVPTIVVVNPSFTLGPDDYVGAPANAFVRLMAKWWLPIIAPIGIGVLDVRDYAEGVLLAAEKGLHGRRYILNGHNIKPEQFKRQVVSVQGGRPPLLLIPIFSWMLYPFVAAVEFASRLINKPPPITRKVLDLWGRYVWYDTSLARRELGWNPRPLAESLQDTLNWSRPKN